MVKTKWATFTIIMKAMVRAPLVKYTLIRQIKADVVKQPYLMDSSRPSDNTACVNKSTSLKEHFCLGNL